MMSNRRQWCWYEPSIGPITEQGLPSGGGAAQVGMGTLVDNDAVWKQKNMITQFKLKLLLKIL